MCGFMVAAGVALESAGLKNTFETFPPHSHTHEVLDLEANSGISKATKTALLDQAKEDQEDLNEETPSKIVIKNKGTYKGTGQVQKDLAESLKSAINAL